MNSISVLKWTATLVTLCGAIATSLRIDPLNLYLLNAGSALFLLWGFKIRDRAMIVVNMGMLLIYFYGILDNYLVTLYNACVAFA